MKTMLFFLISFVPILTFSANIELGIDVFFKENHQEKLKNKKIGLITNHTGVNKNMISSIELFKTHAKDYSLVAIFAPEHGLDGSSYAWEKINDNKDKDGLKIFSLHGKTRRPTSEMLKNIDVLIYDIQTVGIRSYTYITTLFYVMEEAAKRKISVIVLDRPNPINGIIVDGPMLDEKYRSYIGYINVPYCHGMTIAELAMFFNKEYKIGCDLSIIPMKGWKRTMNFKDTNLNWIPPSPNVPEGDTPVFQASSGILGELSILNIGIGYTLPFKIVGAPWLNANEFANKLNEQNLKGVKFVPFHFKPFYGLYKSKDCNGVMIMVTNTKTYKPLAVQYLILGMLKSLYPEEFLKRLDISKSAKNLFCKANGTEEIYNILKSEKYPAWKMIEFQKKQRNEFLEIRKKYLIKEYSD